jgi:hypothetical protein
MEDFYCFDLLALDISSSNQTNQAKARASNQRKRNKVKGNVVFVG